LNACFLNVVKARKDTIFLADVSSYCSQLRAFYEKALTPTAKSQYSRIWPKGYRADSHPKFASIRLPKKQRPAGAPSPPAARQTALKNKAATMAAIPPYFLIFGE
jgi:hypothetical protein